MQSRKLQMVKDISQVCSAAGITAEVTPHLHLQFLVAGGVSFSLSSGEEGFVVPVAQENEETLCHRQPAY